MAANATNEAAKLTRTRKCTPRISPGKRKEGTGAGVETPAQSTKEVKRPTLTIILDLTPEAPSISPNCYGGFNKHEIRILACISTLLKLGVLVYLRFITYNKLLKPFG